MIQFQVRLIILLLLALGLSGCSGSKKAKEVSIVESEKESKEIRNVNEVTSSGAIVYKTMPVYYNTVVEKPCDEFGNLNPINTNIGSGKNKVQISNVDGKLYINAFIDSTENSLKEFYRDKFVSDSIYLREELLKSKTVDSKIKIVVWPWWLWIAIIGGGLFFLLWLIEKFDILTRVRKQIIKI